MNHCVDCKHRRSVTRVYYDDGREECFVRCSLPGGQGIEDATTMTAAGGKLLTWLDTVGGCGRWEAEDEHL